MKSILRFSAVASVAAIAIGAIAMQPGYLKIPAESQLARSEVYLNPDLFENPTIPSPAKAEASDSVNVTIKVTFAPDDGTVNGMHFLPTDITKLGLGIEGKKDAYEFRVPKGNYEFYLWADKKNNDGSSFYYRGNLDIVSDTIFFADNSDANICTSYELTLPNEEPVKSDFYLTTPKTIQEKGNVRNSGQCFVAMRLKNRNVNYNHVNHNLLYQKSKEDATSMTNTWNDTKIYVNTRDIPMDYMVVYRLNGDDGVYTFRFDVNKNNFGDTLRNKVADWKSINLKYTNYECDSVPTKYDPALYNCNGYTFWLNGKMINSTTGFGNALPTDVRHKYWLTGKPNNPEDGYEFAVLPGDVLSSIGTRTYGITTLPLSIGQNGPQFSPFQPLFTGMKIWAYSDGETCYITKSFNPRLNADENTIWGEGFPYSGIYPTWNTKAANPQFDIDVKGWNGEQRGSDLVVGNLTAYRQANNVWNQIWTGKFEKLSTMNTAVKNSITADGAGRFAVEFVDTAFSFKDINGISVRGKSTTRVEYSTDKTDFIPPTITMLNVRNKEDRISSDIHNVEGATVEVYAADLKGVLDVIYGYSCSNIKGVKIEYAPNGNTDFIALPVQENPDRKLDLFWGQNFSAKLDKINVASPNNLYDLRVTAEDPDGNIISVHASPAFKLDHISGMTNNTIGQSYIVIENGIIRAAGMPDAIISIYDLQGRLLSQATGQVDASNISGVCIIKAADANNSLTSKLMIQH